MLEINFLKLFLGYFMSQDYLDTHSSWYGVEIRTQPTIFNVDAI